ncbi:MAG: zf-HC2 domain-containing protein [Gemmatimonadota bacterium]|nr:zf-HC2 domain-containing protein [Gemmatimonadota bacterium]
MRHLLRRLRGLLFRTLPHMISCREFEEFVLDYLDGELAPPQRKTFDSHVRLCPECRVYLEAYEVSRALGEAVCREDEDAPPEDAPESLVTAILAARRRPDDT